MSAVKGGSISNADSIHTPTVVSASPDSDEDWETASPAAASNGDGGHKEEEKKVVIEQDESSEDDWETVKPSKSNDKPVAPVPEAPPSGAVSGKKSVNGVEVRKVDDDDSDWETASPPAVSGGAAAGPVDDDSDWEVAKPSSVGDKAVAGPVEDDDSDWEVAKPSVVSGGRVTSPVEDDDSDWEVSVPAVPAVPKGRKEPAVPSMKTVEDDWMAASLDGSDEDMWGDTKPAARREDDDWEVVAPEDDWTVTKPSVKEEEDWEVAKPSRVPSELKAPKPVSRRRRRGGKGSIVKTSVKKESEDEWELPKTSVKKESEDDWELPKTSVKKESEDDWELPKTSSKKESEDEWELPKTSVKKESEDDWELPKTSVKKTSEDDWDPFDYFTTTDQKSSPSQESDPQSATRVNDAIKSIPNISFLSKDISFLPLCVSCIHVFPVKLPILCFLDCPGCPQIPRVLRSILCSRYRLKLFRGNSTEGFSLDSYCLFSPA